MPEGRQLFGFCFGDVTVAYLFVHFVLVFVSIKQLLRQKPVPYKRFPRWLFILELQHVEVRLFSGSTHRRTFLELRVKMWTK